MVEKDEEIEEEEGMNNARGCLSLQSAPWRLPKEKKIGWKPSWIRESRASTTCKYFFGGYCRSGNYCRLHFPRPSITRHGI